MAAVIPALALAVGTAAPARAEGPTPTTTPASTIVAPASTGTRTAGTVPSDVPALPAGWAETTVHFSTAWGTTWGTWTHPVRPQHRMPATLIIGGSGPVDRNGNQAGSQPLLANNLLTVSRWLATDGQESLRYDKLGSGRTGLGSRPTEMSRFTFADQLAINADALRTLAARPGVNRRRLSVVGHSEGALFALALAEGHHGNVPGVPRIHAVATLEGASTRLLTTLRRQVREQVAQAVASGEWTPRQGLAYDHQLDEAIAAVRAGRPVPDDVVPAIRQFFDAQQAYLRTEDRVDPRVQVRHLPSRLPVLMTCGTTDVQVLCGEVRALHVWARRADRNARLVVLPGTDHVLKVDPAGGNYNAELPFSPRLRRALAVWARG